MQGYSYGVHGPYLPELGLGKILPVSVSLGTNVLNYQACD